LFQRAATKQFETVFHVMHTDQKDGNTGNNRPGIIVRNHEPGKTKKYKRSDESF
jgi:hypothetical protein